jgi:hypothetical protein
MGVFKFKLEVMFPPRALPFLPYIDHAIPEDLQW